ncbi:MAG TPA: M48 family metallopeptidase [Gammaproteobacteria bacterium]|nr:M48 family metallopeptidase [Gammaproteobacteria bacterium]
MNTFSLIFISALGLHWVVQLWLDRRQIRRILAHRDRVPPAFETFIPLAAHQKAADYNVARIRFGMIESTIGVLLLLAWTLGGGLNLLDQFWRGWLHSPLALGVAFLLSAFLLMALLDLPASIYRTFVIEQRFGFNRTTPVTFIGDMLKSAILLLILGGPFAAGVLWLMQLAGAWWWLKVWALWMGFNLLMQWAYPAIIAPLFNRFSPLADLGLVQRIEALLRRTGFTSDGVFVMDGSKRSSHGNAYFTGFGRHKRIVFFDTLLKELAPEEIEAVLAHELGHFRRRHVIKRLLLMAALSLAGLAILGWLIVQPWFYAGVGISQSSAHAALMIFLLISPHFTFLLQPLGAWMSRRHEFEADDYAIEQSDGRALVRALVKLYRENANTLTPDPLYSAYHDSHPPAPLRVAYLQRRLNPSTA